MTIKSLSTVKEGDRVSYEDMANPRRVGTVNAIVDQGWGTQFHVLFEDGELHYSDLRQHGWKREAPAPCLGCGHAKRHHLGGDLGGGGLCVVPSCTLCLIYRAS